MSASNATITCAANTALPIPGDCTVAQHRALQDDVTAKCKGGKRTCKGINDCIVLLENMQKNFACAEARENVAVTCFRGGDAGHRTAITEALNAAAYCERQYNSRCRPRPQPQPVPQPAPQPAPVEDEDFMKKMATITGLSGTALVIYLIISEGSRLFPPRNLIPVP